MKVELQINESELYDEIKENLEKIKKEIKAFNAQDEIKDLINKTGDKAYELHTRLTTRGIEPKHHKYMIDNRGMAASNPEFYKHVHPIEDLINFIEDDHANDDPSDITIESEFEFKVYSQRWRSEDTYSVRRTEFGWYVSHIAIGGSCDKSGKPYLYENLRHDSISYPENLDIYMEWLWDKAATKGLNPSEVQKALNDLSDWVIKTEKNKPIENIWSGI